MTDKEALESLRSDMINGFKTYKETQVDTTLRHKHWDEYVISREAFLRADCAIKNWRYIPLSATIINCSDSYRQ